MAQTQINGATQIRQESITGGRLAPNTVGDDRLEDRYFKADGTRWATGDFNLDGYRITYVGSPQSAGDAANKEYVDGLIQGFDWKQSVRVATTENVALNQYCAAGDTIDGVELAVGDRVLVKDQTSAWDNGIYTVNQSGSPTRADDFNSDGDATSGVTVYVSEGNTNASSAWSLSSADPITLGTTDVVFVQVGGGTLYKAGDGLVLNGSVFNIQNYDGTISVGGDDIGVNYGNGLTEQGNGLQVVDGQAGQVYIANDTGVISPTALSGDVNSITGAGAVTLDANIMRVNWQVTREAPSGNVDGSNAVYTLANMPITGSEMVFLNGLLQEPGEGNDYSISGGTITFADAPVTGDRVRVTYTIWD